LNFKLRENETKTKKSILCSPVPTFVAPRYSPQSLLLHLSKTQSCNRRDVDDGKNVGIHGRNNEVLEGGGGRERKKGNSWASKKTKQRGFWFSVSHAGEEEMKGEGVHWVTCQPRDLLNEKKREV